MATEKLFRRIADLYFARTEGDLKYSALVEKLRREDFKGVTTKTIDHLVKDTGSWLLDHYCQAARTHGQTDDDPENVGFFLRSAFPYLKAVLIPPPSKLTAEPMTIAITTPAIALDRISMVSSSTRTSIRTISTY